MIKEEKVINILFLLKKNYPNSQCELEYQTPIQLLVACILSAQCTDKMVNKITKSLFKYYCTVKDFAFADVKNLEKQIFSSGFYKVKARYIIQSANILLERYQGEIPKTLLEIMQLPGVARKTGNVVLGELYQISEGIVVDTHVARISNRLAWTKSKNPIRIEKDLMKIFHRKYWIVLSHLLIQLGRQYCTARKANCEFCFLKKECPFYQKNKL